MNKRHYHRPSAFARDLVAVIRGQQRLRVLRGSRLVDAPFRERLMLTVTQVNDCRYCAYAHARMALSAGLAESEIQALSAGQFEGVPQDQVAAVLYAQHWAESDGQPDVEVRQRVVETYGPQKTEAMEIYMRMMRVGNLAGNSWDHLLRRVSYPWRWAQERKARKATKGMK